MPHRPHLIRPWPLSAMLFSAGMAAVIPVCAHAHIEPPATPPDARHERIDALFAPHAGGATPGCAVAVGRGGAIDYARGFGAANLETASPITPATPFHAASIAKQFTAFAIHLLERDGKLALDDDIHRHVPELPAYGVKVTLRQLMQHTSGMREQGQLLQLAGWRAGDPITQADLMSVIVRQRSLNHAPGTEILYTNAAYALLSEVVARTSGMSLRAFAQERIFAPLGMRQTLFRDDYTEPVAGRAIGYSLRAGQGWRISVPHADHAGSSSLTTTVGDLLAWQHNLRDGRVGGTGLVAAMQTSGTLHDGTATGYGGGLKLGQYRGLRTVSHDGVDGGYRAEVLAFPDHDLDIVVLCNGAPIAATDLARRIADIYLASRMAPAQPLRVPLPVSALARLAGLYWSPVTDELLRLELVDGALKPRFRHESLHALGGGTFQLGDTAERWRFRGMDEAHGELLIWDAWPIPRTFRRLAEPPAVAGALAGYAGTYRSSDLGMDYEARVVGGRLVLLFGRNAPLALEPASGDRFFSTVLGTVTFTRAPTGAVQGLTVSSRRLRRFAAERVEPNAAFTPARAHAPSRASGSPRS